MTLHTQTTLVIGANRGIGLAISTALLKQAQLKTRQHVIATTRQHSDALKRLQTQYPNTLQVLQNIDITSEASLSTLKESLQHYHINTLIVVAGILKRVTLENLNIDAIRQQFEVNALGPLRVCEALRSHFCSGSKIALITSRMGSLADNTSGSHYGYRMSKAALNMAGRSLAHDLKDDGVAVALLHPGYVKTDMTDGAGDIDTHASAHGLLSQIQALTLKTSGTFWHQNGTELPW